MFNRRELKENAKEHFRKTYGIGVLVTFLFSLIGGSAATLNFNFDISGLFNMSTYSMTGVSPVEESVTETINYEEVFNEIYRGLMNFWDEIGVFLLIVMAFVTIFTFLFQLFLGYPLYVGFRRWYLENRQLNSEIGTVGTVFSSGYLNIIKVMFCRDLFITLWSLLFIVPGIIKSYEYRMVPFLLAENPHMSVREAIGRSRELMKGNKFETFLLDISFIGWGILGSMLCGLLTILYVAPYIHYTEAELYVKLCQKDNYTKPGLMKEDIYSYSNGNTY